MLNFHGVFPPVPTPYVDGKASPERLAENIDKLMGTGLAGFVLFGSNGESHLLSEDERCAILRAVRKTVPADMTLVVGAGTEVTGDVIERTKKYADLGADAALIISPCFYKGAMKPPVLLKHHVAVAEASPIPTIIYNMPANTGINLDADLIAEMSRHPNIVALKDSSGNVAQLADVKRMVDEDFAVMMGAAPVFLPGMAVGVIGGILAPANIAPEGWVQVQKLFEKGDLLEARRLAFKLTPTAWAVTRQFGIPGLKAALDLLGYYGGDPRPPLQPLGGEQRKVLEGLLRDAELL